jgi:hypothetical protein
MAFRILTNRNLSLSDLRSIVAGQTGILNFLMLYKVPGSFHIKSTQKRDILNPTPSELNDFF